MNMLRKMMCAAGRHSGAWSLPGSRCEITRICASCGTSEERIQHAWTPYAYCGERECEQIRRCGRCAVTGSRVRHEWGPWLYLDEQLVTAQYHTCRRCRRTEQTRRFSTI